MGFSQSPAPCINPTGGQVLRRTGSAPSARFPAHSMPCRVPSTACALPFKHANDSCKLEGRCYRDLCRSLVAGEHKADGGPLTEEEEEAELERQEAAVEVVGEMQLTAEQLKVGAPGQDVSHGT